MAVAFVIVPLPLMGGLVMAGVPLATWIGHRVAAGQRRRYLNRRRRRALAAPP